MITSVAIGSKYEIEVKRLQKCFTSGVFVFTKQDKLYRQVNNDPLIDGLYHKCNFANYITCDSINEPVFFCDADMFSLQADPLSSFKVDDLTDIAFVPYPGKWHFPDKTRQLAFDHFGYKINSGFMYFRNLEIAKDVCTNWAIQYLDRVKLYGVAPNITKFEYDEYALMISLMGKNYKIELLAPIWNVWELKTKEEILKSDAVFFQSHDFLDII